jgi:hypothetical protein
MNKRTNIHYYKSHYMNGAQDIFNKWLNAHITNKNEWIKLIRRQIFTYLITQAIQKLEAWSVVP